MILTFFAVTKSCNELPHPYFHIVAGIIKYISVSRLLNQIVHAYVYSFISIYSLIILMHIYSIFLDHIQPPFSSFNSFQTSSYAPLPSSYPFILIQSLISVTHMYMSVGAMCWSIEHLTVGYNLKETDSSSPRSHQLLVAPELEVSPSPSVLECFLAWTWAGLLFSLLWLWQIFTEGKCLFELTVSDHSPSFVEVKVGTQDSNLRVGLLAILHSIASGQWTHLQPNGTNYLQWPEPSYIKS